MAAGGRQVGVFDRHAYNREKPAAFEALAARIDHILRTVR
jgi:hypothetical protein